MPSETALSPDRRSERLPWAAMYDVPGRPPLTESAFAAYARAARRFEVDEEEAHARAEQEKRLREAQIAAPVGKKEAFTAQVRRSPVQAAAHLIAAAISGTDAELGRCAMGLVGLLPENEREPFVEQALATRDPHIILEALRFLAWVVPAKRADVLFRAVQTEDPNVVLFVARLLRGVPDEMTRQSLWRAIHARATAYIETDDASAANVIRQAKYFPREIAFSLLQEALLKRGAALSHEVVLFLGDRRLLAPEERVAILRRLVDLWQTKDIFFLGVQVREAVLEGVLHAADLQNAYAKQVKANLASDASFGGRYALAEAVQFVPAADAFPLLMQIMASSDANALARTGGAYPLLTDAEVDRYLEEISRRADLKLWSYLVTELELSFPQKTDDIRKLIDALVEDRLPMATDAAEIQQILQLILVVPPERRREICRRALRTPGLDAKSLSRLTSFADGMSPVDQLLFARRMLETADPHQQRFLLELAMRSVLPEVRVRAVRDLLASNTIETRRLGASFIHLVDEQDRPALFVEAQAVFGDALAESPLYRKHPDLTTSRFARRRFEKTGSETILVGGGFRDRAIIRRVDGGAFFTWRKAFEDGAFWQDQGFSYVPIEPIHSFRRRHDGSVDVVAGVLDVSLGDWERFSGPFLAELLKEREAIMAALSEMGNSARPSPPMEFLPRLPSRPKRPRRLHQKTPHLSHRFRSGSLLTLAFSWFFATVPSSYDPLRHPPHPRNRRRHPQQAPRPAFFD